MGDRSGVSNANEGVPASSRKVVQSLKEIVNCSDLEIYAMLVECNMDPDETASRLLSQDTFHEVKSKRDKKKEVRRNRSNSNGTGSVQATSANRRENGTRWGGFSSTPGVLERQPPSNSDPRPTNTEVKNSAMTWSGESTSSSLPSHVYQSAWVNANPGQRTMADIVKMGRPLHEKNVDVPRSSETQKSGSKTKTVASPPDADHQVPPASVSTTNLLDDDSRGSSLSDDENNKEEQHAFKDNGGEDVSASVGTGFQQLAIEDEEDQEDKPEVIIPNHLQVGTLECTHLMFGSFGSRVEHGQSSGLNYNLEETQETVDDSSFRHQEDHQYKFSSSADYILENSQQLNPPSETNHHMQNLYTFPYVMQQGYTSSLSNTLLPSNIQDVRESDLHYSLFPTKYNTTTPSSLSGPTISMAEALSAASIPHQNAMSGVGQQAAALAQHLTLNSYSHQPEIPLGHYGNLISYPFMPPGYNPYMPTDFQQGYPVGNLQSLAAMLPQYKTQATAPPVPPPLSAYGFGGGASSSNNFPVSLTDSAKFCEDVLNSQFKESNNHLASSLPQQNENSAAWHEGQQPNSHVVSGSGYYSFPSHQNQQPPGFCQAQQMEQQQQPSQPFGGYGYFSPYHLLQAPISLNHLLPQHQQPEDVADASEESEQQ